jgi:hypothetical protein
MAATISGIAELPHDGRGAVALGNSFAHLRGRNANMATHDPSSAAATFHVKPTVNACGELIAASIAFSGNFTNHNQSGSLATKPSSMSI